MNRKICTMNCGPAVGDTRTREERMEGCEDCITAVPSQPIIDSRKEVALPHTTYNGYSDGSEPLYTEEQMHDYANAVAESRRAGAAAEIMGHARRVEGALRYAKREVRIHYKGQAGFIEQQEFMLDRAIDSLNALCRCDALKDN